MNEHAYIYCIIHLNYACMHQNVVDVMEYLVIACRHHGTYAHVTNMHVFITLLQKQVVSISNSKACTLLREEAMPPVKYSSRSIQVMLQEVTVIGNYTNDKYEYI